MNLTRTHKIIGVVSVLALALGTILFLVFRPKATTPSNAPAKSLAKSPADTPPKAAPAARKPEVYHYDTGIFNIPWTDAEKIAKQNNAQIATLAQIAEAQKNGADWCRWGWTSDGKTLAYPLAVSTDTESQCPNPHKKGIRPDDGVYKYTEVSPNNTWGLTLYGIKPLESELPKCENVLGAPAKLAKVPCIIPFSSKKWSQYS
jgi:hypothetical protein